MNKRGRASVTKLTFIWTTLAAAPASFELSREACAIGIAALTLLPMAIAWLARRRLLVADPIIVLGAVWLLAVTLPVLLPDLYKDRMWYTLSPWSLDTATLWMYRGWAACCMAYWGARLFIGEQRGRMPGSFDRVVQVLIRRWIGVLGFLGTVIYVIFVGGHTYDILEQAAVPDSTPMQIIFLFKELSYVYMFLYFYTRGPSGIAKIDTYVLVAVLAAQAVVFIGSGSKYSMMALAAAWLLGNATSISRAGFFKEMGIVVAGIGAFFIVSYAVAAYRGELISRTLPNADAPITEVLAFQSDVMVTAVTDVLQGKPVGEGFYTNYDSSSVLDRVAHVSSFALVLETLNGIPPYENAYASLIAPVFAVIPRAFFETKVHFMDSGDFARMQGWTHGGLSITTPGSFFWAWGYAGIIAGMAVTGAAVAWLWMRASRYDSNALIWQIVMISSLITLLDVGVTFQAVLMPATRVLILVMILRWGVRVWIRSAGMNKVS